MSEDAELRERGRKWECFEERRFPATEKEEEEVEVVSESETSIIFSLTSAE